MGSTKISNNRDHHPNVPIPKSPNKEDAAQLGFKKQPMVDWFSPSQLAQTGLRAVISSIFGSYSDKREIQAALTLGQDSHDIFDYSDRQELWIDYVSDMGSGWNSTYSIAYLLGRKMLHFNDEEGEDYQLPRGDILCMGGDQVYPTPTWEEYENRLTGPYSCSLPAVDNPEEAPSLFAIPGNHDWYDGLSSFLKLFCQGRTLGAWSTKQTRSYFALKLPFNWWLWGIDIQLSADIDKPQLNYFDEVCRRAHEGDTVILCTAQPVWVYQEYQKDHKAFDNLDYFKLRYARKGDKKLNFKLMLTGDMHHYTSFKEQDSEDPKWKITAGGGGAFLHPTHQVPDLLHLDHKKYKKSAAFPDSKTSKKLAWNNLRFPFINKKFGVFFAVIYLLFTWWAAISHGPVTSTTFLYILSQFSLNQLGEVITLYKKMLLFSPGITFLLLLVFGGIVRFTDRNRKRSLFCWILGIFHGLLQVVLMLVSAWITAILVYQVLAFPLYSGPAFGAAALITAVLGWLLSGYAMAIYLLVAILFLKTHETEAFSSFRGANYKNFIRMKIDHTGIKLYPVKVPKACKKWKYNAGVQGEHPWYEPQNNLCYSLIEKPIVIKNP